MGLGAIGLVGAVGATGLNLYGQAQQAKAQSVAAAYNNRLAENEAANLEVETAERIKRQRINIRESMAELRNRMAGSGLITTSGTPLLLAGETAGRLELSIQDAARQAAIQAASARAQGKMGLFEAKQAGDASKLAMFGSAMSGATSVFGKYQEGAYQGLYRIGKR
jgi:hypothetical protein